MLNTPNNSAERYGSNGGKGIALWFALHIRAGCERYVADLLARKRYECFLPTARSESTPLLFPGYLFCRFAETRRLPILLTPGVVGILKVNSRPAPIRDTEVLSLQEALRRGFQMKPWLWIPSGPEVTMTGGPLAGLTGLSLGAQRRDHLIVAITPLRRAFLVEVEMPPIYST